MDFTVIGKLRHVETFAAGRGIRELVRLNKTYGVAFWRKRKGIADIRLPNGAVYTAELHWHEAAGIGTREMKIKRLLEAV